MKGKAMTVVYAILGIIAIGTGVFLYSEFAGPLSAPVGIGLASAGLVFIMIRDKFKWLGICVGMAAGFVLGWDLFLGANELFPRDETSRIEPAKVVNKYSRIVNRYRGGRRRVYAGKEHHYYVVAMLPDSALYESRVSAGEYVRLRKGRIIRVETTEKTGLFGYKTIRRHRVSKKEQADSISRK